MTAIDPLAVFLGRIQDDWLPNYCADPKRNYSPAGFRSGSVKLAPVDAADCMRAIDAGIVKDAGHGRFLAARGQATEPLFWEGSRLVSPRPITFWHEPAITFAALARLHFDYGWPVSLLGNQPKSWAFDLAAHEQEDLDRYRILGEVKKTKRETEALIADLLHASDCQSTDGLPQNSEKKWQGLLRDKPSLLWIVGPAGFAEVFSCEYPEPGIGILRDCPPTALCFPGFSG
ncbi:MAG: hypothetical protein LC097_06425 [Burkholderiales bacterium]|nr:hypothetical protein [Burkholderiales bacterium]